MAKCVFKPSTSAAFDGKAALGKAGDDAEMRALLGTLVWAPSLDDPGDANNACDANDGGDGQ